MSASYYQPIYELTRGETVESVHFGAVAIVNVHAQRLAWYANPQAIAFLRSTAKPFQALPFLEAGGQPAFDLAPHEIALMCASHSGRDEHVAVVQALQAKAGIREADLRCGVHPPYDRITARKLRARSESPTPNRHNCSGKHSAMLAYARLKEWGLADYIQPTHPVQVEILRVFAQMCSSPATEVRVGIDGCSAPNFAIPLTNTALAYARLCDPEGLEPERAAACQMVTRSMTQHPDMVGGPGRFDTRLMEVAQGRMIAKGGAEGYQGMGLLPGVLGPDSPAVGIAVKIADGDIKGRAIAGVSLEILRQLGVLSLSELQSLEEFGPTRPVRNWRDLEVGVARPCFTLQTD